ncbi:unnamed protein product [Didymodactylos carnosus]|uniref:Uncharacterized protein n=1 Tax=Didymodactylos carnosus TaxID=1234261 RepID=A0A814LQZ4_9BILA|nr:unnamed protein product [Didymodactylos carnosus]CAF1238209.1 unnamed protein product [Didymodactylos carnosus]CAF3835482.1 unnamed protein product [Didymodactylos carnosus]CAF4045810.1 unnamed protein product [Didymodactylos carnosus]
MSRKAWSFVNNLLEKDNLDIYLNHNQVSKLRIIASNSGTDDLQYSTEYSDDNTDLEQTTEDDNQNKSGCESSEEIMNSSSTDFSSESDHNEDNNNDRSSEEIELTLDDAREVITSITNVLLKCRKLVNHFRRSTKQTGYLKKRIGKTLRCHSLIIDCPIRWNSSFSMIDRLITLKNHINAILNDTNKQNTKKVAKIYLTTFEWSMIGDLHKLLKPFKIVVKELSGSYYPTLSKAYNALRALRVLLNTSESNDSADMKVTKKLLLAYLNRYFPPNETNEQYCLMRACAYLEPKQHLALTNADILKAEQFLTELFIE